MRKRLGNFSFSLILQSRTITARHSHHIYCNL
jgi:hypothetical protein